MLNTVFLAFGSNFERKDNLCKGLSLLKSVIQDVTCSPVFESVAQGIDAVDFWNIVVSGKTNLSIMPLVVELKRIESSCGRTPNSKTNIPLDIDLLTYDNHIGIWGNTSLPHADILTKFFVLKPLSVLAPNSVHPINGVCYKDLWEQLQSHHAVLPLSQINISIA